MKYIENKVKINNQILEYCYFEKLNSYQFSYNDYLITLVPWTWGQKNSALEASLVFTRENEIIDLNILKFNESLILNCVTRLIYQGQYLPINQEMIDNLDAKTGELLMEMCLWINQLNSDPQFSGPSHIQFERQADENGLPFISIYEHQFFFRRWSWGEKKQIIGQCFINKEERLKTQLRIKSFNELMLFYTLEKVLYKNSKVVFCLKDLQNLEAWKGDLLLETAIEINELIEPGEKKSYVNLK